MLRKLPKMMMSMFLPASETFNETEWKIKHPDYTFIKTRPITGIDPVKFDNYNIRFITKDSKILKCSELLSSINFTPIKPYYIVRGYIESDESK